MELTSARPRVILLMAPTFPQFPQFSVFISPRRSFRLVVAEAVCNSYLSGEFSPNDSPVFPQTLGIFPQFSPSFPQAVTVGSGLAALKRFSNL